MKPLAAPWKAVRAWPYLDVPLGAFVLVMVAAAAITSHGTFVFYCYILPVELAAAATVVLTVGIPLLELAAVLDKANRGYYVGGMVVLLIMEGLAQYLQGQAIYVDRVRAQFPNPAGIDLAMLASHPAGRILPILYLAILSLVVVYFGYAASARVRDLRANRASKVADMSELASVRSSYERMHLDLAQARAELSSARANEEQTRATSAQQGDQVARLQDSNTRLQDMVAQLEATIAQLRSEAAQEVTVEGVDMLRVARRLREAEVPMREVAQIMGVPESTLRGRLERTNGTHA